METSEKVMIACLLISEGGEEDAVKEFISVLDEGMALGELDAVDLHSRLMKRMDGPLPSGAAGAVIRLMKAKREHDAVRRRYGMAVGGLSKALSILNQPVKGDLGARILVGKAMAVIGETREAVGG